MAGEGDDAMAALAAALDLPPEAGVQAMVERVDALRLVREAVTLDQVRRALGQAADASPLTCAELLCQRLPPADHYAAVLRMLVIERSERIRALRVDLIRREAVDAARGGAAG